MNLRDEIDGRLLQRAIGGDRVALDRAIEQAWPHGYRIAFSILREREAAQDAAQEACAIVYRTIAQLRSPAAFAVWFYRIVMRQATLAERRMGVRRALDALVAPSRGDTELDVVRLDVVRAIAKLPRPQRACVVLQFYAQMNSREIAEVLGIADGTVRFHLHGAKRALAALLDDRPHAAPPLETAHAF